MNYDEKELAKNAIKAYLFDYASKNNDEYVFNEDKCDKMNSIIAYCQNLEKENNCEIIRCMLEPKYIQGYIQVLFKGEFAFGDKNSSLNSFINTLIQCDGINITTNPVDENYFQITFFVDNLWKLKSDESN